MNNSLIIICFKRLFYFIQGFIKSPFVMLNSKNEIKFRTELASLYEKLVTDHFSDSSPYSPLVLKSLLSVNISQFYTKNFR